jgi:hypothetical protein
VPKLERHAAFRTKASGQRDERPRLIGRMGPPFGYVRKVAGITVMVFEASRIAA